MLEQEDNIEFFRDISLEDLCSVLETLKKDEILILDGWTIDFYHHFFELVGKDLVCVMEEIRLKGKIKQAINTTFLALIPKLDIPCHFQRFLSHCSME
jgi:hypothetical protein